MVAFSVTFGGMILSNFMFSVWLNELLENQLIFDKVTNSISELS
jgi:hypothetical protein